VDTISLKGMTNSQLRECFVLMCILTVLGFGCPDDAFLFRMMFYVLLSSQRVKYPICELDSGV
jgi:hypothetical protein